jgi:hypothetical protein
VDAQWKRSGSAVEAQWKRSGSAVEAQWKRSGSAADVQRYDCCDLKQGVPMTAPQNRPKILRTPHHLSQRPIVPLGMEIGEKSG